MVEVCGGVFEQLVVRRELADNFCLYNEKYDSVDGFPNWVREDIPLHRRDPRLRLFTEKELEEGRTDDPLWNAAQHSLVSRGGCTAMRMYWAKRILEWTPTVEEALQVALALNDRWQLDGAIRTGTRGLPGVLAECMTGPGSAARIFGRVRYATPTAAGASLMSMPISRKHAGPVANFKQMCNIQEDFAGPLAKYTKPIHQSGIAHNTQIRCIKGNFAKILQGFFEIAKKLTK